jgi:hypothetical protein
MFTFACARSIESWMACLLASEAFIKIGEARRQNIATKNFMNRC